MEKIKVEIFVDGACSGNPGPGGWGALLRCETVCGPMRKELSGYHSDTTNNRMELMAAIEALRALKQPCKVILCTDSQYVKNGITEWIITWRKKNWKTSSGAPVKNQDLWQTLDLMVQKHKVEWKWVKGHVGHPENERCDQLARNAIRERRGAITASCQAKPRQQKDQGNPGSNLRPDIRVAI